MFAIVQFGLRSDTSKHHIRVCVCLAAQFAFFSRADSGVLLTTINAQATSSTFAINQSAINVARIQAASSSRLGVSSTQDDSGNCFNKLQLRWNTLCAHRDTDLNWFLTDDSPSCFKDSGIISEWLLLLLVELNIPTLSGVNGLATRYVELTPLLRMPLVRLALSSWLGGLWKSLE
jgi:hypothetical protein